MKKKFFAFFMVIIVGLLSLTGCQNSKDGTGNSTTAAEVKLLEGARNIEKPSINGFEATKYSVNGGVDELCEKQVKLALEAGYKADGVLSTPIKVAGRSFNQLLVKDKETINVGCIIDPFDANGTFITLAKGTLPL